MTSGIINAEDARDDDWIMVLPWCFDLVRQLGLPVGRSPWRKIVVPRPSSKVFPHPYAYYVRRRDLLALYTLATIVHGSNVMPAMRSVYGFPATDRSIVELDRLPDDARAPSGEDYR